jgi:hypothetical protein
MADGQLSARSLSIALYGLIGSAIAALHLRMAAASLHVFGLPYVKLYDDRSVHSGLLGLLVQGDGQSYAALARDPTMAHPSAFKSAGEAAYRYQRPLLGALGYLASLGRSARIPMVFAIIAVIAAGLAVAAIGALLLHRGVEPAAALLVFLIPGVMWTIATLTPELLALAFVGAGIAWWEHSPRRVGLAVGAFTLAALTRESMLLVPFAIACYDAAPARRLDRSLRPLAIPFLVYLGWVAVVAFRVAATPISTGAGNLTLVPFSGPLRAVGHFAEPATDVAMIIAAFLLAGFAITRLRADRLAAVVLTFALYAPFADEFVWQRDGDFVRVLLPLYVFGAVLVCARVHELLTRADRPRMPASKTSSPNA